MPEDRRLMDIYMGRRARWPLTILSLLIINFFTIIVSLAIGSTYIPSTHILEMVFKRMQMVVGIPTELLDVDKIYEAIIFQIRLPRVLLASLVGGSLAVAGVVFQGIFKNPMADPYVIGVSSGAALGASSVIILGLGYTFFGSLAITIFSFITATISLFIVYNISRVGSRIPITTLLLSGIAMGIFLSAIVSFLHIIAGEKLHALVFWLMGGFSYAEWRDVQIIAPFLSLGFTVVYIFSRDLNILQLSEEEAAYLGVDVEKTKRNLIIFGSLLTAAAVSVSGLVGFVGLIIPHMMRILVGPDHRILLPSSLIAGASFLVICDTIARIILPPIELPVGIITAFSGTPFFIYLLRKTRGRYRFFD
ncbi:MAG: iron chelate uptake ABC transporter family permease subunit [Nitrososphaerota archaeon]|nr:iron chelate uptake ABC transporter family permease subunit [Nitrososphaerota archaeon]